MSDGVKAKFMCSAGKDKTVTQTREISPTMCRPILFRVVMKRLPFIFGNDEDFEG